MHSQALIVKIKKKCFLMNILKADLQNIYNRKSAAYSKADGVSGFLTAAFLQSDKLVKGATVHQTVFVGAT